MNFDLMMTDDLRPDQKIEQESAAAAAVAAAADDATSDRDAKNRNREIQEHWESLKRELKKRRNFLVGEEEEEEAGVLVKEIELSVLNQQTEPAA